MTKYAFVFFALAIPILSLAEVVSYYGGSEYDGSFYDRKILFDLQSARYKSSNRDRFGELNFCLLKEDQFCVHDSTGEFTFYVDKNRSEVGSTWDFSSKEFKIINKFETSDLGRILFVKRSSLSGKYEAVFQFSWRKGIISFDIKSLGLFWLEGDCGLGCQKLKVNKNRDDVLKPEKVNCLKEAKDDKSIARCLYKGKVLERVIEQIEWNERAKDICGTPALKAKAPEDFCGES